MRGGIKVPLLIAAFVLAVVVFIRINEGTRRAKLEAESQESREKAQEDGRSGGVVYMPPTATNLFLMPGDLKQAPGHYSEPTTVRLIVDAQQRVAFALVTKDELNNYNAPNKLEYAGEHLLCGTAGAGHVTISCELPAEAKDLTLVIADLRDHYKATQDRFQSARDKNNPSPANDYVNSISLTVMTTFTPPTAK